MRDEAGYWRVRAGAVFATMFGVGLLLRLFDPFGRAPGAELAVYGAAACIGLALMTWGLMERRNGG